MNNFDEDIFKNKNVLNKVSEHFMDLDVHYSTALEGNSLTLAEVSVFIDSGITVHGKKFKDYMEVHNYNDTLTWLKKNIHNNDLELSLLLIKQIHKMTTEGTVYTEDGENFSGRFRNDYVFIKTTTHVPPHWEDIEERLEDAIDNYYYCINSGYSVFEAACNFHREYERIHPFFDGNGRSGRILLNLLLVQDGYPYLTIKTEDRTDYFDSIENNDFYNFAKGILYRDYAEYLPAAELESNSGEL